MKLMAGRKRHFAEEIGRKLSHAAERHHLLSVCNDTATAVPEATLAELFAAQAARSPQAIAVEDDNETLTYRELDTRANHLAGRLNAYGAGPETIIAVALPRSTRLVTALLAIVKTGAAYLPIDTQYPSERTAHILTDAAARLLITDTPTAPTLPDTATEVLLVDTTEPHPGIDTTPNPAPDDRRAHPGNLAYLMYTSGSTGQPKAVMITHRNVVNMSLHAWPHEAARGRIAMTASPGFETANPVRSFKARGAEVLARLLVDNGSQAVVCASAGNLGQALAWSGRRRGLDVTVVASRFAPAAKLDRIRALDAMLELVDGDFDMARERAAAFARHEGARLVEDSLDIETCEGAATIGLELVDTAPSFDTVLIALGGGALATGVGHVIKAFTPEVEVICVQPLGAPAMTHSWRQRRVITTPRLGRRPSGRRCSPRFARGLLVRREREGIGSPAVRLLGPLAA